MDSIYNILTYFIVIWAIVDILLMAWFIKSGDFISRDSFFSDILILIITVIIGLPLWLGVNVVHIFRRLYKKITNKDNQAVLVESQESSPQLQLGDPLPVSVDSLFEIEYGDCEQLAFSPVSLFDYPEIEKQKV